MSSSTPRGVLPRSVFARLGEPRAGLVATNLEVSSTLRPFSRVTETHNDAAVDPGTVLRSAACDGSVAAIAVRTNAPLSGGVTHLEINR